MKINEMLPLKSLTQYLLISNCSIIVGYCFTYIFSKCSVPGMMPVTREIMLINLFFQDRLTLWWRTKLNKDLHNYFDCYCDR